MLRSVESLPKLRDLEVSEYKDLIPSESSSGNRVFSSWFRSISFLEMLLMSVECFSSSPIEFFSL